MGRMAAAGAWQAHGEHTNCCGQSAALASALTGCSPQWTRGSRSWWCCRRRAPCRLRRGVVGGWRGEVWVGLARALWRSAPAVTRPRDARGGGRSPLEERRRGRIAPVNSCDAILIACASWGTTSAAAPAATPKGGGRPAGAASAACEMDVLRARDSMPQRSACAVDRSARAARRPPPRRPSAPKIPRPLAPVASRPSRLRRVCCCCARTATVRVREPATGRAVWGREAGAGTC